MNQSDLPSESSSLPEGQPDEVGVDSVVTNLTAGQFHFFVKLPLEIQLKIWECICFIPRVVDVFSSGTGCEALHNLDDNFHDLFGGDLRVDFNATHCHPPTILHINMPAHIYINWECDVVCPMGTESRDRKDMEVQLLETKVSSGKVLRYLAIDPLTIEVPIGTNLMDTMDFSDEETELSWAHLLMGCPKLEEIILYPLPDNYRMHGTPLELIGISEVDIERGVGFKVPELKKVRDVILNLNGRIEMSRKATEVRELSKVQEVWVPLVVRIMGVTTGRKTGEVTVTVISPIRPDFFEKLQIAVNIAQLFGRR
ncbi:uncharacterized protein LY89DRAFT_674943 [Mollisia scopiformis]|uniref:2EXR domain-containing protein n=1 Tax=Mollisia scopiformis TaxID=149040 RepID=A0A194WS83_MOLSC|nr:uncharacterized protein LY89DRAFT_674943 [Mollisia scopiformis]KUJ10830.1 hypothetical protein LY89DRAFT_674943 [Mollisia scopiformis]